MPTRITMVTWKGSPKRLTEVIKAVNCGHWIDDGRQRWVVVARIACRVDGEEIGALVSAGNAIWRVSFLS